jgi:hypothetical protein
MTGSEKRKAQFLIAIVMVMTAILAVSLPGLNLLPGMPLPQIENNDVKASPPPFLPQDAISINRFMAIFFGILVSCAVIYTLYKVIRGSSWKDILGFLRAILGISLFMMVVMVAVMLMPASEVAVPVEEVLPTPAPPIRGPLGPIPPVIIWFVGFILLAIGTLIAIWVYRSLKGGGSTIDLVGKEAARARQDLMIGVGLKDVIIRCYRQMSLVLQQEHGLERKESMTTYEFELLLEEAGVPDKPIRELTRLFNLARYGNWNPNPQDEQNAIDCFDAIVKFSQEAREAR